MAGYAQSGELYFCMTMQEGVQPQDQTEGIYKSVDNANDPLFKTPRYFFRLKSVSKGIHITFAHISVNPNEWYKGHNPSWKDQMEIKAIKRADIINYYPMYNFDTFFKDYSREQLIDWFESLDVRNKKIYFFDRRDYKKDKITLIQVELLDYGRGY